MASGGARPNSGPAMDPDSGRSDRRGIEFGVLNAAGYDGPVPKFPLMPAEVFYVNKDGERIDDEGYAQQLREREAGLWEWAWRTPQACAWAVEPWRVLSVANWVRLQALCETDRAKAADKTALLRLSTQIGLSPEGLALNRWTIGEPALDPDSVEGTEAEKAVKRKSSRDRLPVNVKVVEGGGA